MRAFDGVSSVRMNIMKDFIFVDAWLDEAIEKMMNNSGLLKDTST